MIWLQKIPIQKNISVHLLIRAILKIMWGKPRRYCTDQLYRDCKVLRVRQLYILKAVIAMHSSALKLPDYEQLLQRRVYRIPASSAQSTFAKRQATSSLTRIYNSTCRRVNLRNVSLHQAKRNTILSNRSRLQRD